MPTETLAAAVVALIVAESEAQARDVPRARVLKDEVLIELALAAPRSAEALANLRAFPRGMERSRAGAEILAAVERGFERDPKTLPKIERERRNGVNVGATVELLKVLLRQVSEDSGVAGKLIATVDELEAIAHEAGVELVTLAVAWVLANPAVTAPIIGASRPEQLAASLAGATFKIDDDLAAKLDELTRPYRLGDSSR